MLGRKVCQERNLLIPTMIWLVARVKAQPMPTMMDLGQYRSLKQHTLTVMNPSGIGASPLVLLVIRLPVVTNLKLFGTHF